MPSILARSAAFHCSVRTLVIGRDFRCQVGQITRVAHLMQIQFAIINAVALDRTNFGTAILDKLWLIEIQNFDQPISFGYARVDGFDGSVVVEIKTFV